MFGKFGSTMILLCISVDLTVDSDEMANVLVNVLANVLANNRRHSKTLAHAVFSSKLASDVNGSFLNLIFNFLKSEKKIFFQKILANMAIKITENFWTNFVKYTKIRHIFKIKNSKNNFFCLTFHCFVGIHYVGEDYFEHFKNFWHIIHYWWANILLHHLIFKHLLCRPQCLRNFFLFLENIFKKIYIKKFFTLSFVGRNSFNSELLMSSTVLSNL